jgi:hypothetical protein
MKISYSDEQKRLLQLCGVPQGLLMDTAIDPKQYLKTVQEEVDGKLICNIKVTDQQKTIKKLNAVYRLSPTFFCLHSSSEYLTIRKYAVPWFFNAAKYCKSNVIESRGILPYWHYVDTKFDDSLMDILRDRNTSTSFLEYQPLIVLDGNYTDSSSIKLEKLRDLLNLLTGHTVILLLSGDKPYSFCLNKLGLRVTDFISFGATRNNSEL